MQALVLAGGEGTRLRPLTATRPKPVVPLAGRPFVAYVLDWLRRQGVDRVVMSCGHMGSAVREVLGDGSRFGVGLQVVEEPAPLGTGGALKLAEPLLDERFLMVNGDVLTDIDLTAQIARHDAVGARATLALTPVEDPSAYGVVRLAEGGEVLEFVEKPGPGQAAVNTISAGAYVLERSVLELLEAGRAASIERDVFPELVGHGLFGHVADGYWLDIGTPERYLQGTFDILEGRVSTTVGRLPGAALVRPSCEIGEGARIGRRVVLDSGVTIGEHTAVEDAVVLPAAEVGAGCRLRSCIVADGAQVGDRCVVEDFSVVGPGAVVPSGTVVSGRARLEPGSSPIAGAVAG